jgi:hypothetical protein
MSNYDHLTPSNARPVIARWEDIMFSDNWNEDEMSQVIECVTMGWLLEETATQMIVASSYNWKDGEWATIHALPKVTPTVEEIPIWEDE